MPIVTCTLMVGLFCFEGSVTKIVDDQDALWTGVTVSAADYAASASWGDVIITPDWRRMNEACVENFCVRYIKHCTDTADETQCSYQVGRPGDEEATTLFIRELSKGGIARAERSISYLSDEASRSLWVPLSALVIQSAAEDAPPCPREQLPCLP